MSIHHAIALFRRLATLELAAFFLGMEFQRKKNGNRGVGASSKQRRIFFSHQKRRDSADITNSDKSISVSLL